MILHTEGLKLCPRTYGAKVLFSLVQANLLDTTILCIKRSRKHLIASFIIRWKASQHPIV